MKKGIVSLLCILTLFSCYRVDALGGYIGESAGLDFYSRIDEGALSLEQKMVTARLRQTPKLHQFASGCPGANLLDKNAGINEQLLRELPLSGLDKITLAPGVNLDSTSLQSIANCLGDRYTTLQSRARKELDNMEQIGQGGLYMDGDTANSEYDIIADIEKIHTVIFSTPLKYSGTRNTSSKSLANILAGKDPGSVIGPTATVLLGGNPVSPLATLPSPILGAGESETPPSVDKLLGTECRVDGRTPTDIDNVMDASFVSELENIIGGGASLASDGYSASDALNGASTNSPNSGAPLTKTSDYSDKMPCQPGDMFCIKVRMIPGGRITLGGGRTYAIESIIDTYSKHLDPISESDLSAKRMTNANGQSTEKNARWTIAGLKVYLAEKGQPIRTDKTEMTPQREKDKLEAILACARVNSGLPTDEKLGNMIGGAGFVMVGSNSESQMDLMRPIGVLESINAKDQINCYKNYMEVGRRLYASSFSSDITSFQAFTDGLLTEIKDIITILDQMDKKPTEG